MLDFQFMRHDKWANVLFVHWSVPSHLESLLLAELNGTLCSDATRNDHANPDETNPSAPAGKGRFVLDRYKDGRAYVGLILLTEVNVGPICGRSIKRLLVTHHGSNIRTYVRPTSASNAGGHSNHGADGDSDDDQLNDRGITFASLECDDAITAAGANLFGMPYKVANMERTYYCEEKCERAKPADRGCDNHGADLALIRNNVLSTKEVDDLMCGDEDGNGGVGNANASVRCMGMRSVRTNSKGMQGMLEKVKSIVSGVDTGKERHKSKLVATDLPPDNSPTADHFKGDNGYFLDCEWEVDGNKQKLTDEERNMASFVCERYHVYTQKYGLHWKGTVHHEPWPVEKAKLKHLVLYNIDQYEPSHMRPLLRHMSETSPESVLYSAGVGPVDFQMLKPV